MDKKEAEEEYVKFVSQISPSFMDAKSGAWKTDVDGSEVLLHWPPIASGASQ
eukprot:CAMPEP_0205935264 /NCGR_PEP_ID=MMETSP1325-20131115/38649_1 /ASSEMBLY_ACC=CAM_ASM_000708 /TAXON_ID=236786 /ORGANISM="Florenciella sp., Strain RCC1007" /LENGTH=51 /DNA_ID=CAMNT_0053305337 /DNA_START=12 /DNA_END=165 /DNA_ORIENTATION=+